MAAGQGIDYTKARGRQTSEINRFRLATLSYDAVPGPDLHPLKPNSFHGAREITVPVIVNTADERFIMPSPPAEASISASESKNHVEENSTIWSAIAPTTTQRNVQAESVCSHTIHVIHSQRVAGLVFRISRL